MIREIIQKTLGKKKLGWKWDNKREVFVTFQVDTSFNGTRHVRRGFSSEKAASDYAEQLKTQERLIKIGYAQAINYPTVKKLFETHLKTIGGEKAQGTAQRVYKKFLSLLVNNLTVNNLRRKHFRDYVETRIGEGIKAESANREMTFISAALHKASDYFGELETWQVPRIYRPQVSDEGRSRVITRNEREKLLDYFLREKEPSEREKDFIARRRTGLTLYFGLLTGLRHGEICGLQKINFNRPARRLKAERFKTRRKGIAETVFEPLTETQMWVLDEAAKLYPNGEFFFSERGKLHNKIYTILKNACLKLEIPYGINTANGFVFHDTRHSFVTNLIQNGVDLATAKSLSGHSTNEMLMRYSHATDGSRARAMRIIETEVGGLSDLRTIG